MIRLKGSSVTIGSADLRAEITRLIRSTTSLSFDGKCQKEKAHGRTWSSLISLKIFFRLSVITVRYMPLAQENVYSDRLELKILVKYFVMLTTGNKTKRTGYRATKRSIGTSILLHKGVRALDIQRWITF
jgi:hypothetical protein